MLEKMSIAKKVLMGVDPLEILKDDMIKNGVKSWVFRLGPNDELRQNKYTTDIVENNNKLIEMYNELNEKVTFLEGCNQAVEDENTKLKNEVERLKSFES